METILHCTEGNSDKLYRVSIEDHGGTFSVRCANCRRGNPWVDQGYKASGVSLAEAEHEAEKIVKSKVKKGYNISSQTGFTSNPSKGSASPASPSIVAPKAEPIKTGFRPQLLNVIEEHEAEYYASATTSWMAQEKMDGVRHMIFRKAGRLGASNKLGFETTLESKVMTAFEPLLKPFLVDGELVGEVYYAFDLLEADGKDLRKEAYAVRYHALTQWLPQTDNVVLVPVLSGGKALIDEMRSKGAEGVVFKRQMAHYEAGRPNSGGDQFKFKFQNTASFIVTGQTQGKRSVAVALLDGTVEVPVGNCTIPANHSIPAVGTIVEVRYLYAYRGGSIFQPCYLGERNDILREECGVDQLKFKGEGVEV